MAEEVDTVSDRNARLVFFLIVDAVILIYSLLIARDFLMGIVAIAAVHTVVYVRLMAASTRHYLHRDESQKE